MIDNRENEPMSFCQGCDAGHQDGKGCIIDIDRGCWLEGRYVIPGLKGALIRFLAFLNIFEGSVHLVVVGIGLWGCIAIKVFDIRVMTPIVENFVFGFFSILTGLVMSNMIRNKHKKRAKT